MHRFTSKLMSCVFCIAILTMASFAQDDSPDLQGGIPPFSSYHSGSIDKVSLQNGNLFISIPLFDLPQRGNELTLSFSLVNNNKLWATAQCAQTIGNPICPSFTICPPNTICSNYWTVAPSVVGISVNDDQLYHFQAKTADGGHTFTVTVLGPDGTTHRMGVLSEDLSTVSEPVITAEGRVAQVLNRRICP